MNFGIRAQHRVRRAVAYVGMFFVLLFTLFPIYWMVLTAIKPKEQLFTRIPVFWTWQPTLDSIRSLLAAPDIAFPILARNSLLVALSVTACALAISTLAALSLTRLRYWGRATLGNLIFFAYLLPPALLFIPMYILITRIQVRDTLLGLVLAYLTFSVPFCTWMLRGYFVSIPRELEEAGMVDGCTRLQALWHIVLPVATPGVVAAAIFAFTQSFNEFLYAMVLTDQITSRTLPVGLSFLMILDTYQYDQLMAGALLIAIPSFVLYTIGQRFVVAGLTAGAVKD
jgi:multiple sugar transport system permease protein